MLHYLDHAATTPVPPAVAEAMVEVLTEGFGNPSSQYELGRAAAKRLEQAEAGPARPEHRPVGHTAPCQFKRQVADAPQQEQRGHLPAGLCRTHHK